MIGEFFTIVSIVIFSLSMAVFIGCLLFNFLLFIKSWLYDKDFDSHIPDFVKKTPVIGEFLINCELTDPEDLFFGWLVMPFLLSLVISLTWPLLIICGSVYLPLYALRGFIRFKTKVNKAMENTDKEGHTHEY